MGPSGMLVNVIWWLGVNLLGVVVGHDFAVTSARAAAGAVAGRAIGGGSGLLTGIGSNGSFAVAFALAGRAVRTAA